jgi:hypothetical protein
MLVSEFLKGTYRHYKGNLYELIDIVHHSETLEKMVLYKSLYENSIGELWVRPYEMFFEEIEVDGKMVKRFERIS